MRIFFAILVLAAATYAEISIETAGNAEIASFLTNEADKSLQVPDSVSLNLKFETAKDEHSRAGILFFVGKRSISMNASYTVILPKDTASKSEAQNLSGYLKADTSWLTGYCGMLECQTKPMPAEQRITVLKSLSAKIFAELKDKIGGAFVSSNNSAGADSLSKTADTSGVASDTVSGD